MWRFQSTLLQEERLFSHVIYNLLVKFQSTLLQEERLFCFLGFLFFLSNFNPRSYKRSDSEDQKRMITIYNFNPRSYKRSDWLILWRKQNLWKFQSTLLQEERLIGSEPGFPNLLISIHAPTRGATYIRSLSRGLLYHFNPRSYKRSDQEQENRKRGKI